ncbi:MAG: putative DNA binding domain-containing protein [Myxococcota bacterium]
MTEPGERWTEAMLAALEPHEHDFQEFKGRGWLLADDGQIQPHFLVALSKQVSAFANGGGGRVFLGLDDAGKVDGGVPVHLKGGTRAWLEDLVTHAVDPPLKRCNVFEAAGRELRVADRGRVRGLRA